MASKSKKKNKQKKGEKKKLKKKQKQRQKSHNPKGVEENPKQQQKVTLISKKTKSLQ